MGRHSSRWIRSAPTLALALLVVGCGGGPRFAESFDSIPERRSASNVLTIEDMERYPSSFTLHQLMANAFPNMEGGIYIRGMGMPLFVLDGIPLQDHNTALGLSVRDLQRVEVLRDGASSAWFGFRGSNGAVLVTTRR